MTSSFHIDNLVQDCSNSSVLAMEPSMCGELNESHLAPRIIFSTADVEGIIYGIFPYSCAGYHHESAKWSFI